MIEYFDDDEEDDGDWWVVGDLLSGSCRCCNCDMPCRHFLRS